MENETENEMILDEDFDELDLEVSLDEDERTSIADLVEEKETEPEPKVKAETMEQKSSNLADNSKKPITSSTSNKVFISIDNDPVEVLQLQEKGMDLFFEDEEKAFLKLPGNIEERLNTIHFTRYKVAEGIFEKTLNIARPRFRFVKDSETMGYATAKAKLHYEGGDPNLERTWQYEESIPYWESMGARVCTDPDVKTFTSPTGTSRTITESSGRKLVLIEIPKEIVKQKNDREQEKARQRSEGFDDASYAKIKQSGGNPVSKQQLGIDLKRLGTPRMNEGV